MFSADVALKGVNSKTFVKQPLLFQLYIRTKRRLEVNDQSCLNFLTVCINMLVA